MQALSPWWWDTVEVAENVAMGAKQLYSGAVLRWGTGALPPNLGLAPNILVTAVTHQHTGAKMSVTWPSKYAKMHFQPWLRPGPHCGSSRHFPSPPVGWGGHMTPQTTPHSAPSAPRFSRLRRSPIGPSV